MRIKYSLMIHGGAGMVERPQRYRSGIARITRRGQKWLTAGKPALEVVERCVMLLEDDPLFNAGRGSVLGERGTVEMDAALMDGATLAAGAVAGVALVKNPVHLARLVMQHSQHVFLSGPGAVQFGKLYGAQLAPVRYFTVPTRVEQWREAKKHALVVLDHSSVANAPEKKFGTVGAVAFDASGNLAAATSTGGIVNKRFGRVGDTPLIGAGTYADNATCAVSATGYGEQIVRTVLAKHIADAMRFAHMGVRAAVADALVYFKDRVQGLGGVIVINKRGVCVAAHTTPAMLYGSVTEKAAIKIGF